MIVVLTNKEDSLALLQEAERQGLMNGEYVFFLVQHFEVSGNVVSKTFKTQHIFRLLAAEPLHVCSERVQDPKVITAHLPCLLPSCHHRDQDL